MDLQITKLDTVAKGNNVPLPMWMAKKVLLLLMCLVQYYDLVIII